MRTRISTGMYAASISAIDVIHSIFFAVRPVFPNCFGTRVGVRVIGPCVLIQGPINPGEDADIDRYVCSIN